MKLVTTSWDDGHILDLKMADLLARYGLTGTFYVSPKCREFPGRKLLTDKQVRHLSKNFEIGAHTMTHPRLTKVGLPIATKEIVKSKDYLERLLGKKVLSFCYPGGMFNKKHQKIVEAAGFKYARTVKRFKLHKPKDPFAAGTTVHAYKHYQDIPHILIIAKFNPTLFWKLFTNWDQLAITLFDSVPDGGVYHLWGHSWEIDNNGDWARLENVFKHVSRQTNVLYVTNGQLKGGSSAPVILNDLSPAASAKGEVKNLKTVNDKIISSAQGGNAQSYRHGK